MCSQEGVVALLNAPLFRSTVCSHSVLCAAARVASFLARFLRPRAFFPLGIATILCHALACLSTATRPTKTSFVVVLCVVFFTRLAALEEPF